RSGNAGGGRDRFAAGSQQRYAGWDRRNEQFGRFLLRSGNSAFGGWRFHLVRDPERGDGTVFSWDRFRQDRVQHGESQLGCRGDGGRQRLIRWPGARRQFDRARALLLARRRSDVEPRHAVGRRRFRFGYGGGLQREPGGVSRFYPAARAVLLDRRPAFYAAD